MKTRVWLRRAAALLLATVLATGLSFTGHAAEDTKIVGTFTDDETLKIYVKNAPDGQEAEFQIGNRTSGQMSAAALSADDAPMRTLIMVDNSNSVAKQGNAAVSLIQAVISAHTEGEVLRLATFSDSISYLTEFSDDYLALYNAASGITFQSQSTYLTDVLLPVLTELASDGYAGFTRIVIISDGVDNKELGLTRAELTDVLEKRTIPVYTVGVRNGTATANEELEGMFSISRMTNANTAPLMLEENGGEALLQELAQDAGITVFRAEIPEALRDGSTQNVQLTFSDGSKLSTKVDMPFGAPPATGDTSEPEPPPQTTAPVPDNAGSGATEQEEVSETTAGVPLWAWILIGAGALLLLILLIVFLSKRGKKKPEEAVTAQTADVTEIDSEQTEIIRDDMSDHDGNTELLFANNGAMQVTLEDVDRPGTSFTEVMNGQIIVGRSPEQAQIVITYEKSVSRTQCRLFLQNGQLHVENLSEKNMTKLNDKPIYASEPLYAGDILTMGRVKMRVTTL